MSWKLQNCLKQNYDNYVGDDMTGSAVVCVLVM